MNVPIARLFGLVVVLFALLIAYTSRWTVFESQSLRDNPVNARSLLEEQRIARGSIRAADGTVLARSRRQADGTYVRTYPTGALFSQAIGYAYTTPGRASLEASRNDELTGRTRSSQLNSIIDQLTGRKRVGDQVITTLDPKAQRVALQALGGQKGAVIALDPRTGAIKVFAAVPGYDPNLLATAAGRTQLAADPSQSRFDRVTQSGYQPGSTFKVVTAIAAIDSGQYTPASTVDGSSPKTISGVPLMNDFNESFGPVDLTTALTKSINTVWAQVAVALGKSTMAKYMGRLGFGKRPPIDLPTGERQPSGEYLRRGGTSKLLDPRSSLVDVGRMGIGQDKLNVTPLQMAMVAAAVANHGTLMTPHLTDRAVDRDGRSTETISPTTYSQVMKPSTADAVAQMMAHVVQEGTGTAAALQGIQVAGKTGTAEVGNSKSVNQVWFIAFAPLVNPRIAIAATVERSSGQGGTVAAPIAKQVLQSLLGGG
ncbi:MAG: penicillin-binding protein [Solirubrobacteraceae bacterium]|jgi:peptidoglycan glycosyltransferase|nr:penicillin-binding protein [Solirubrobacteraceae bacterium]MEA2355200.1 penicillin-binding protein [Solirubrobacteraceae bacterium]